MFDDTSTAMDSRSARVWAQGFPGTNSKRHTQYPSATPRWIAKQEKCYVWDYEGNKYIDFVSGLGTSILGYNHPKVNEAVIAQIHSGYVSGSMPTFVEVEAAEALQSIVPHAERIRFLKTGNEATLAAVRIARAYTGRKRIFSQGYHGHGDFWTTLTEPAIGVRDHFEILPWDGELDWVAGWITEPVLLEMNEGRKKLLKYTEEGVHDLDGVVIYDEIVTGMRVPKYTISRYWNLEPDLICLGKGIASGFPLSVVAGKREIMEEDYFISSTFSGEAASLAACKATIEVLRTKKMEDLMYYGERLRTKLNDLDKEIDFEGYGSRAMVNITHPKTALFAQECAKAGLLIGKAWFYNFSHLEEDIEDRVLNICGDVLKRMKRGECKLEGEGPEETFTR